MKELFPDILSRIPDYQTFLTPDELDQSSRELAARYPGRVRLLTIGKTKNGHDLLCLKIGEGSRNALLFGCPHPNEPIGTMMLEYFSRELAENEALLEAADYTWYIVKAWDRDGLEKNEGWLKGPFDIYHYSRYFFRPAGHQQVDWTFPIDYKNYHFDKILPESQAMKDLIELRCDRIRYLCVVILLPAGSYASPAVQAVNKARHQEKSTAVQSLRIRSRLFFQRFDPLRKRDTGIVVDLPFPIKQG